MSTQKSGRSPGPGRCRHTRAGAVLGLHEGLEYLRLLFLGHADPRIADGDQRLLLIVHPRAHG
jgi:hypothetical protein